MAQLPLAGGNSATFLSVSIAMANLLFRDRNNTNYQTYNPNGKHASLVIYVRGNTIPGETRITITIDSINSGVYIIYAMTDRQD